MNKIHLQMGLGDCFSIIRSRKDLFLPIFINENRNFSFTNSTILEGVFSTIGTMRANLEAHYTGAEIKFGDEEVLTIYLKKINKCLDEALK